MGVYLEFRDLGRCWATWGELFNYQSSNRYQLINIDYIVLASDSNELKFSFKILPMGATQVPTLRLCLVRVKAFPENISFSGNAIFRKGKCFYVFGCISKNFPKNIFWCLENAIRKRQTHLHPGQNPD